MGVVTLSMVRGLHSIRLGKLRWLVYPLICATVITAALAAVGFHHLYFDRTNLPDIGPFARFGFPTVGHIYDSNGQPLVVVARQYRRIANYEDIPPIVRDAILAAEGFFLGKGLLLSAKIDFRQLAFLENQI